MRRCPTCGQEVDRTVVRTGDHLLEMLRADRRRDVYMSQNHSWHLTYTPDCIVEKSAIHDLLARGEIRQTYAGMNECFTTNRTIDLNKTMAERKAKRIGRLDVIYI